MLPIISDSDLIRVTAADDTNPEPQVAGAKWKVLRETTRDRRSGSLKWNEAEVHHNPLHSRNVLIPTNCFKLDNTQASNASISNKLPNMKLMDSPDTNVASIAAVKPVRSSSGCGFNCDSGVWTMRSSITPAGFKISGTRLLSGPFQSAPRFLDDIAFSP